MAITSYGYPAAAGSTNGSIDAVAWARTSHLLGSTYAVMSAADFKVTAATNGVSVSPGTAHGCGITDVLDTATTLPLAIPTTGSRHWLVSLRRRWETTNRSDLVAHDIGGALPSYILTSTPRYVTPGVVDDQPLAYVSWEPGATALKVTDLRLVGSGKSQVAFDARALGLVAGAGHQVWIDKAIWEHDTYGWKGRLAEPLVLTGTLQSWAPSAQNPAYLVAGPPGPWAILTATIPDMGVPYRIRAYAEGEWGCDNPTVGRWDFHIMAGSEIIGRHVAMGSSGLAWRTIHAPLTTQTFQGQTGVSVQAKQILPGSMAMRTAHNSRLWVEVCSA